MCNRYVIITAIKDIQEHFRIDELAIASTIAPQVNVAAGSKVPVVINTGSPNTAPKTSLQLLNFGLVAQGRKKQTRIINAFNKSINHNRMFRKAIRTHRCLIPANGFIQWTDDAESTPYLVYQRNTTVPFMMAGIWDEWMDEETGTLHRNFAIITTVANTFLQRLTQKYSPVVFSKSEETQWLNKDLALRDITAMLKPFNATGFTAAPIPQTIKSTTKNDRSLLTPAGPFFHNDLRYNFSKKLELQGMGETAARKRRRKEDADLPDK